MNPIARAPALLCLVALAAGCQLPSASELKAERARLLPLPAEADPPADGITWAPRLPGRDLGRDESLAYAVREVLGSLPPDQQLAALHALAPAAPHVARIAEQRSPAPAPAPLCGSAGPECARPLARPELVRLPTASEDWRVTPTLLLARESFLTWLPAPPSDAPAFPTVAALRAVLGERIDRLGSEELAIASVLLGTEVELRAERASRRGTRKVSLGRIAGWLRPLQAPLIARTREALTLTGLYALSWPVPRSAHVSSEFGLRVHPILGTLRLHRGVDIAVPTGTPIHAPAGGVVRKVKEDSRNGRWLELDHGDGLTTVYCHLSEHKVAKGAKISAGELVGLSGATGYATGPHLHYQLHLQREPLDPLRFRAAFAEQLATQPLNAAVGGSR